MGSRGPAPTPTETLRRRGSKEANRRKNEPKPRKGVPPCPDWLGDRQRQAWEQVTKALLEMGVLTVVDGNAVARYCVMWLQWRDAAVFLENHGNSYELESGYHQQYPEVGIVSKLAVQLLRLEQEFGLTPASRARIHVQGEGGVPDGKNKYLHGLKVVG